MIWWRIKFQVGLLCICHQLLGLMFIIISFIFLWISVVLLNMNCVILLFSKSFITPQILLLWRRELVFMLWVLWVFNLVKRYSIGPAPSSLSPSSCLFINIKLMVIEILERFADLLLLIPVEATSEWRGWSSKTCFKS